MLISLTSSIIQKNYMYMLISIIFIAELIIAYQLISFIMKADRKICDLNCCLAEFKPLAQTFMQYLRLQISNVAKKAYAVINIIKKRKEQAFLKVIMFTAVNVIFFTFKIKRIKPKSFLKLVLAALDVATDISLVSKI